MLALPKVMAHRGACHYAPENTLAALQKAHELHIGWTEFDVMLTADGMPIVIHDETLERTSNGRGLVAYTAYADIANLDAGSWFSKAFAGEKIPTFAQFLQRAAQLNMGINVEIKPTRSKDRETALAVIETLRQQRWLSPSQKLLISSFSITSLISARVLDKSLRLGLLLDSWFSGWQDVLQQLNCISLHANYRILNPEKIATIKSMGCYVLAYTVNDPKLAQKLFAWGVDTVFSNVPDIILRSVMSNT